jgi:uncharacterized protein DUF1579
MRCRPTCIALVFVAAAAFFAGRLARPGKAEDNPADPAAAMQALVTPGKDHKLLEKRAGNWDYAGKLWTAPGAPASEFKGKNVCKMVLGGRFLFDVTDGDPIIPGGEPFHGMGLTGFDNFRKKYINTWADNMTTAIMHSEGERSADGTEVVYATQQPDLMSGDPKKMVKSRTVEKRVSDDQFVFQMFDPGPDGKEVKVLEITYTRKK